MIANWNVTQSNVYVTHSYRVCAGFCITVLFFIDVDWLKWILIGV
jgi:hypothetical protein